MKRTITFLLLLLTGSIAACSKGTSPPLAAGVAPWSGYEPFMLAQQQGYLSDRIKLNEYATSAQAIDALKSGTVQLATMTLDEALLLRRDVPDLKIILLLGMRKTDQALEVAVVRDESIGRFHSELLGLLGGWQKAQEYIAAEPAKAAASMAQQAHVASAEAESQFKSVERYDTARNRTLMLGEQPLIATRIDAVQHDMLSRGQLQVGVEAEILVDNTLLTEISDKRAQSASGAAESK